MLSDKSLREHPPFLQMLLLVLLCMLSGGLLAMIALSSSLAVTGLPATAMMDGNLEDPALIPLIWYLQGITAIGVFLVPGLIFSYYWNFNTPFATFGLQHRASFTTYAAVFALIVGGIPLIYTVYGWNQGIELPAAWTELENQLRASEAQAEKTIGLLMQRTDITALLINIGILVLLPAVGEEIIFRGILQRSFFQASRNPHIAIWVTAILFSAIHMQWFGFLPRMLLGACFGYLVFWTGSLLPAIFGHFVNNGMAVLGEYSMRNGWVSFEEEQLSALPWWTVIASVLLTILLLYWLQSRKKDGAFERLD
jgi:membrane protease YdiL (CAAX protease family)